MKDTKLEEAAAKLGIINALSDPETTLLYWQYVRETVRMLGEENKEILQYTGKVRVTLELHQPEKQDES